MTNGYRQVILWADNTELVCWIPNDDRVRKGSKITLKEIPDVVWLVKEMYDHTAQESPRKTWRVGGLQ